MRLSAEIDRSGDLRTRHEHLAQQYVEEREGSERLERILATHNSAHDVRMDALHKKIRDNAIAASSEKSDADDRLVMVEKMCEMIGFQKFGGMWHEKKKQLADKTNTKDNTGGNTSKEFAINASKKLQRPATRQ